MSTVKLYNKKTNTTYVYHAWKIYDRTAHKSKVRRKLIGKVDASGNIVPTGPVGRPPKNVSPQEYNDVGTDTIDYKGLYERYRAAYEQQCKDFQMVEEVQSELNRMKEANEKYHELIKTISSLVSNV